MWCILDGKEGEEGEDGCPNLKDYDRNLGDEISSQIRLGSSRCTVWDRASQYRSGKELCSWNVSEA